MHFVKCKKKKNNYNNMWGKAQWKERSKKSRLGILYAQRSYYKRQLGYCCCFGMNLGVRSISAARCGQQMKMSDTHTPTPTNEFWKCSDCAICTRKKCVSMCKWKADFWMGFISTSIEPMCIAFGKRNILHRIKKCVSIHRGAHSVH